jgi:hypothetical protein
MAMFSDGDDHVMNHKLPGDLPSAGDMRLHLQALLDDKEKQLQLAGTLGQRILAQQMELEERINQITEFEVAKPGDEVGDAQMRDRLQELAGAMHSWEKDNEQLWSGFGPSKVHALSILF